LYYPGQPNAPYASVAGNKNLYPYGTPLVSPNFPNQQFRFVDTGSAPGIRSGSTFDIATGSKQQMYSPYINRRSAQFYPGTVPNYGRAVGTESSLGNVSDVYGGSPDIQMGIDQLTSSQGPAYNTPYQFQQLDQPFGFDTSGNFGAQPLPTSPDFPGSTLDTGLQMPPMTSMPNV